MCRLFLALAAIAIAAPATAQPANQPDAKLWRLGTALGVPAWLALEIEQNSRLEYIADEFRPMASDGPRALLFRTLIAGEARRGALRAKLELLDGRVYATDDTPLNTTHVDPVDILQAYVGIDRAGALMPSDRLTVKAGRMTIDLASRRLVARNLFRNTINAFTGVDATWTSPHAAVLRAFVVMPVNRLPGDPQALKTNRIELDEESTESLLWTLFFGTPPLRDGSRLETFVLGFRERDGRIATRNRRLVTIGARWFRTPEPGKADFRFELMPQFGTSRATAAPDDMQDLDHRAFSSHVSIGVTAAMPWKPRFALDHDYATGDRVRGNRTIETFDPLFGARRLDFGPIGIFGPVARSNIHSPGLRVTIAPRPNLTAFASYRLFWLASATDTWGPAGVRDPSGRSGSFLGELIEAMARWRPIPNLTLEVGPAYLRAGAFALAAGGGNAAYVYSQMQLRM